MLKILTQEHFDFAYGIMRESFPTDELRPYEMQKKLFEKSGFKMLGLIDEQGGVKALITIYEFEKFIFAEHFAVNPAYRNGGLGGQILRELQNTYAKPLCLEVEPPETEMAVRRIGFYKRNGFYLNSYHYIQPPLAENQNEVELKLMSTGKMLTQAEFTEIKEVIYREVYGLE